jgi:hypothetical protein
MHALLLVDLHAQHCARFSQVFAGHSSGDPSHHGDTDSTRRWSARVRLHVREHPPSSIALHTMMLRRSGRSGARAQALKVHRFLSIICHTSEAMTPITSLPDLEQRRPCAPAIQQMAPVSAGVALLRSGRCHRSDLTGMPRQVYTGRDRHVDVALLALSFQLAILFTPSMDIPWPLQPGPEDAALAARYLCCALHRMFSLRHID